MTAPSAEAPLRLRLRRGRALELGEETLRHPGSLGGGEVWTPYDDVTHVAATPAGLRLGTRSGAYWLRRADFAERDAPERLAAALRARIARRPGGFAQLERMARLDALAARPGRARLGAALALACAGVFAVQLASPELAYAGVFSALLVRLGEPWRIVTANFLHASPAHLLLNALGLAALGLLAERSLGGRGAGAAVALAGVGAMAASYAAGYEHALGASGLVYGLAGALLWLELRAPEALPVAWRLPRRLFVGLLALETLLLVALPGIAHAAHAGGFLGGAVAAALAGPRLRAERRPRRALALANGLALGLAVLAAAAWLRSALAPDVDAIARRGEALLEADAVPPELLNNEAWRIAIAPEPGGRALRVAQGMAERAAEETGWSDPAVLDTLAEIHFAAGRTGEALRLADAAIALAPEEPYYREQRRRFAGERPRDARPRGPGPSEPPGAPERPRPREREERDEPGLRV